MEKRGLEPKDYELIEAARAAIAPCYDGETFRHTVGCALRCAGGKIYRGVNVYSLHGSCAEPVAIGAAVMDGARGFDCIVAVHGGDGRIMPPCGNCRQILSDYMPGCWVIVGGEDAIPFKVRARDLIPFAYEAEY